MTQSSVAKFDQSRANEYARQSRVALAGYDACHELCACMLAAAMPERKHARILVVGAGGTAGEIIATARLEPGWTFLAIDPSPAMAATARDNLQEAGLEHRVDFVEANLADIDPEQAFDGAIMVGVLHHLQGDEAKHEIMAQLAARLKEDAPLVFAGNYRSYSSEPLLLGAWAQRWRMHGADPQEVKSKMDRILQGAEPPQSEAVIDTLLEKTGFTEPTRFFASLFWGAWFTRKR